MEVPSLLPLPAQPDGVPWPAPDPGGWPEGQVSATIVGLVAELFGDVERFGDTYAVVVAQGGRLLLERYGGALPSFETDPTPVRIDTNLLSWSMAKSITHALVGLLVGEDRLELEGPAAVPAWRNDERVAITLQQLLEMRSGLAWSEDYTDAGASDVIEMLFGSGQADTAEFAIGRPLANDPGSAFVYSSGTTNIVTRIVGDAVGDHDGEDGGARKLLDRLLGTIGATSADARFDPAGTFLGSSFVYATARDFARFGLLYLRDGWWDGEQVLPEGWVDHGRRLRSIDPDDGRGYGAHWWVEQDEWGTFSAIGYEGQSILVCPAKDAVVVRLGRTVDAEKPALVDWRGRIIEAL